MKLKDILRNMAENNLGSVLYFRDQIEDLNDPDRPSIREIANEIELELGIEAPGLGAHVIDDGCQIEIYNLVAVNNREETILALSELSGIREDTLLKAIQSGRLPARKSGKTWLSTLKAVRDALEAGRLRQPK